MAGAVGIGLLAVGTAVSISGQISSAEAQAEAKRQEALIANKKADELIDRVRQNESALRQNSIYQELQAGAAFSAGGGEGGGIGSMLQIHANTESAIINMRRDTEFKAKILRAGGTVDSGLANQAETASYYSSAGTVLGAASQVFPVPASKPDKLGLARQQKAYNDFTPGFSTYDQSNSGGK